MNANRKIRTPLTLLSGLALAGALTLPTLAAADDMKSMTHVNVTAKSDSGPHYVFAGDGLIPVVPFVSTKTRAEVRAEYFASRDRGDWVYVGDGVQPRDDFQSTLTRAEVRAELAASQARGDWVFAGDQERHRSTFLTAPQAKTAQKSAFERASIAALTR